MGNLGFLFVHLIKPYYKTCGGVKTSALVSYMLSSYIIGPWHYPNGPLESVIYVRISVTDYLGNRTLDPSILHH